MAKTGPIVVIDDDLEDCELAIEAIEKTGHPNSVVTFQEPDIAFHGLLELVKSNNTPLIIFCDINLPKITGIDLKKMIDQNPVLRDKSIPFVFLSTAGESYLVQRAYSQCMIQGFFVKESRLSEVVECFKLVLNYWTKSKTPNA